MSKLRFFLSIALCVRPEPLLNCEKCYYEPVRNLCWYYAA